MRSSSSRHNTLNSFDINYFLLLLLICIVVSANGDVQSEETEQNSAAQNQTEQASAHRSPPATLAISYLRQLSTEATEVIEVLEELKRENKAWNLYFPPLATNEDGRALATNIDNANVYAAYAEKIRPSESSIDLRFRRIGDLLRSFQQQMISNNPTISKTLKSELRSDIKQQLQEASELLRTYKNDRETIEVLVAKGHDQPLSDISLEETIQNNKAKLASNRAARISKVEKEEYERHSDELIQLAQEIVKLEQEKIIDEQEMQKRQLALDIIESQVNDPTIQVQFGPFLEKGHYIPHPRAMGSWRKQSGPASPLSYSFLAEVGVFDDLKIFVAVGCSRTVQNSRMPSPANDRTIWPYPQNEVDWAVYQKRFELFKRLSPAMRNKGLLAP